MRITGLKQRIIWSSLLALLAFISIGVVAQTNVALDGTATASSTDLPASAAIDGDMNTRWASAAQTDPSHITIDLGQAYELSQVIIHWEAANADTYEIQGSNDNANWATLATETGGSFGDRTDNVSVSGIYRYVRMYGISRSEGNYWGYSIWQFEINGQEPTQATALTVQAQDYVNYFDTTAGNTGGAYRNDDVDIEPTSDVSGDYNVGWTDAGEWLEYDVSLAAGTYSASARVASAYGGGSYTLSLNGNPIGNNNAVGGTGGWQSWDTQSVGEITVPSSGTYTLRVDISSGGFNLNWIELNPNGSSDDPPGDDPGLGDIVPLYNSYTELEPDIQFDRGDALVTRFSDRARDRHAREDHFQAYDHYLNFYWEHRTAAIEIVDYVAKGGSEIRMNVRTQWRLNDTEAENRWFYRGVGTVAEYCDNGTMVVEDDFNYHKERSFNCREGRAIQVGDKLEFEISQFLDPSVPNGRAPYYGTTYLYIVGEGLVAWDDTGGATPAGGVRDSVKIPERAWLGGETTIHADTSNEPHNRFMQMATNLGYDNGQPFVLGRRVLHTSFVTGVHDERPQENPVFTELAGLAGPLFVNDSCAACHDRNGRAVPNAIGEHLDQWAFRVGDADGNPHPALGRVLQPETDGSAASEGQVSIASWTEANGLRSPNFQFTGVTPERFSARIAPQIVGMGLLEAIPEADILALADPNDSSGNGISGRAQRVIDPETGETRLGRFGWKAGTASVRHQVAAALNAEMGVMTSVLPDPDCGANQTDCGDGGPQLSEEHLENLVKYISLLGVPPQRDYDSPAVQNGEAVFSDIGCAECHTPTHTTSEFHPLAELRGQTIHPYTDLLLHDMGPGLADNLGEGEASGSEWRTAPLWSLGLSACVTGGVTNAPQGERECTPVHGYLHDGRARTIEEAILWHGGEGEASRNAYQALSSAQKEDLLAFLRSL
ncbi:di-heme oxidoredictase family protein [Marinimicrobium sp. ABcell2]|uniref:di-heme oxidoredictase family protein n=1 Tax=Marinimicrobium sp. ABcell2 TaxID=3069751 RepID=UPI0027B035B6|nr:di-heme oxidoredictase family protein [Marinimicrobium sp. ABcell2]MDQ2076097.1 di-heme oxidoredictase family protein [Marinimicrobium sp. ABcell2]